MKNSRDDGQVTREGLFPIGIGAWGLGGFVEIDPTKDDKKQINALVFQLNSGMNFTEINYWNSRGKSVELIKKAIGLVDIERKDLFLLQSIYNYYLPTLDDVKKEFKRCLELFEIKQVDSIQFPLTAVKAYGFENLVELIKNYLDDGLARYVSVTNFNLEYLKKFYDIFGDKMFSHELHYSFEVRDIEDIGIIKFGEDNGIINVPYQPLRRNRTANLNWPLLVELSKKYGKTQNQIILRWMIQRGMHPLVKSENVEHVKENLDAVGLVMEDVDIKKMSEFRVPNYKSKVIDWWMEGKDPGQFSTVSSLPNIFDEEWKRIMGVK